MMKLFHLLLFTSYFLCCESQECHNCVGDFNRERNVQCARKPSDCGRCIPGFAPGDNNLRYRSCFRIDVTLGPPPKLLVDYSDFVALPCEFSGNVRCGWTKDGHQVDIYHSERFLMENIELDTTNCTLIINNTYSTDSGVWQCGALSDSNSDLSIKSEETILKVLELSREKIAVDVGYEVLLTCFSDEPIECQWWTKTSLSDRYEILTINNEIQYVDKNEGPKKDCSIQITNMWRNDIADHYYWSCWAKDQHKHLIYTDYWPGVYFNSMAIGNQTISIRYLKRLDKNGQFNCLNDTMSIEFISSLNSTKSLSLNSNGISLEEIENYNQKDWTRITLTCFAEYYSTQAVITNDESDLKVSNDRNSNNETNLKTAIHPRADIKMAYGQEVILECGFNAAVFCEWSMAKSTNDDFETVKIEGMYEYIEKSDSKRTNCTIRINKLDESSKGRWKCRGSLAPNDSKVESNEVDLIGYKTNPKKSHFLQISFKNVSMVGETRSYEDLKSSNGEPLRCATDTNPSEMKWFINRTELSREYGVQTLNLELDAIDAYYKEHLPKFAILQCDTVFNNGTIISVFAKIIFPTPQLVTVPEFYNEVAYNEAIALTCVFDAPVRCGWTRRNQFINGFEEISITGNYEYLSDSPGPRTDCSIKIWQVGAAEEGAWKCCGFYGQGEHVDSDVAIVTGIGNEELTATPTDQNTDVATVGKSEIVNDRPEVTTTLPQIENVVTLKTLSTQITSDVFLLISLSLFTLLITKIY